MPDKWKIQNLTTKSNTTGLGLFVALPIAQIVLGTMYLKECTQQHYIPVFVLVCGVFGLFQLLLSCLYYCQRDHPTLKFFFAIWNSIVSGFIFCWFIAGSVWIYTIYPPNYNSTVVNKLYCNKTLYCFAFWTTTLAYILLALLMSCFFCFHIYNRKRPSQESPQA